MYVKSVKCKKRTTHRVWVNVALNRPGISNLHKIFEITRLIDVPEQPQDVQLSLQLLFIGCKIRF